MKDNSTGNVKVTYFSNCVGDGPMRQTNKCSGLRVGSRVQFTAKIEVVKCPKDPREWRQTFEIYPVGINETVLVDLEMMCQCDCEKPGNPVNICFDFLHRWKTGCWESAATNHARLSTLKVEGLFWLAAVGCWKLAAANHASPRFKSEMGPSKLANSMQIFCEYL